MYTANINLLQKSITGEITAWLKLPNIMPVNIIHVSYYHV